MATYAFLGLGLIGGSLAKSIRKVQPDCRIYGFARTQNTLTKALTEGIIHAALTGPADERIAACDMVFLCAPVEENARMLPALKTVLGPHTLLTDVGSVKTGIHQAVSAQGLSSRFIGGHPMAGSEKTGVENATDHLFENAYYILTPGEGSSPKQLEDYAALVSSFLAIPMVLPFQEHDYITAAISHLPHVIASSLVNTVHQLDGKEEHMKQMAAGGFKDITRIASSSPQMWEQICVTNRENISRVMDTFIGQLSAMRDHMNQGDGAFINRMFASSRAYRDSFSDGSHGSIKRSYRIYCDVIDESGAIATIATILAVGRVSIKNIGIVHNREFEEGVLRIEFYDQESSEKAARLLRHHRYQVWEV